MSLADRRDIKATKAASAAAQETEAVASAAAPSAQPLPRWIALGVVLPGLLLCFVVNNDRAGDALGLSTGAVHMLLVLWGLVFLAIAAWHQGQRGARLRAVAGLLAFVLGGAVLTFAAAIITLLAWMQLVGLKYQMLAGLLALLVALTTGYLLLSWRERRLLQARC